MAAWRGCGRHYHRIAQPPRAVQLAKIVAEVVPKETTKQTSKRRYKSRRTLVLR
jgi:hypothetical protein